MKIIGKTASGYLCEINEREIANAAGFYWENQLPREVKDRDGSLRIGATIHVCETFGYISKLKDREKSVRDSVATLDALARMLEGVLPTTIIPPENAETSNG